MPPKNSGKKKAAAAAVATSDGTATPYIPSLAEQLSYLHCPRPFKNPDYAKNVNRRMKNIKAILSQERERERLEREKRRLERLESMDVDGQPHPLEDDIPSYTSIDAPPSVLPPRHYCDVTGLEAPYKDPATKLRYHDKSVYEHIKSLPSSAAKDYLAARGVNPIVK